MPNSLLSSQASGLPPGRGPRWGIKRLALALFLALAMAAVGSALVVRYWLWPGLADLLNDPVRLAQSTAPYLDREGLTLEVRDARAEWTEWLAPRLSIGQIRLRQQEDQSEVLLAESISADFGLRSLLSPLYGLPIFSQLRVSGLRLHARKDNNKSLRLAGFQSAPAQDAAPSDAGRQIYKALSLQGPWTIHQAELSWEDYSESSPARGQVALDDLTLTLTDEDLALETLAVSAQPLSALLGRMVWLPRLEGQIGPMRLQWKGDITEAPHLTAAERIERLRLDVQFQNIGFDTQALAKDQPVQSVQTGPHGFLGSAGLSSLSGLSGRLLLSSQQGSLALQSNGLTLGLPRHLPGGRLTFDEVSGQIDFSAQELAKSLVRDHPEAIALTMAVEQLTLRQADLKLQAQGRYRYTGEGRGRLEAKGSIGGLAPAQLSDLLPLTMGPETRAWLVRSIQAGRAVSGDFEISGALADFPYRNPNTGAFAVRLRLEDQTLAFDPLWPKITGAFVDLTFERSRLSIESRQAVIGTAPITRVTAEIPDLGAARPVLHLQGEISGPLANMVDTVNRAPIRDWLGQALVQTSAQGPARLALDLHLDLDRGHAATVQGQLVFQDNRILLDTDIPEISGVRGSLAFNEKGLTRLAVSGRVLGGPFSVVPANPRAAPITRLAVKGELAASALESWLRQSAGIPLATGVLAGKTPFGLTVDLGPTGIEVLGQSSLRGLAIRLPVPARKRTEEDWGLQWSLQQKTPADGPRTQAWRITTVSHQLSADILRTAGANREAAAVSGRVGLGMPVSGPKTKGIVLQVASDSLDLSAWIDAFEGRFTETQQGPGLARVELQAQQVMLGGQRISGVQAKAASQSGVWRIDLQSAQVSGQLAWAPNSQAGQPGPSGATPSQAANQTPGHSSGTLVARLERLWLPPGQASDPASGAAQASDAAPRPADSVKPLPAEDPLPSRPLTALSESRRWPTIDLIAEDFRRGNKQFGRLVLDASPATDQARWDIRSLTLENPHGSLSAKGQWAGIEGRDAKAPPPPGSSRTLLNLSLQVRDGAALLDRLGYPGLIRGTPGTLSGQIQWAGAPTDFALNTLEGQLALDLQNGQFLKADAGLAKLISVVNLQSLPKRITLDFRDIFSEGFVYERVRGTVGFSQGLAKTENLRIVGIQASVFLEGEANLLKETQDLHVLVLPELNAGLASLGYALVNPAVGLGSFIAQYILRDPLRQALAYEYKVTGAWDDPQVKALPRRPVPPSNQEGSPSTLPSRSR